MKNLDPNQLRGLMKNVGMDKMKANKVIIERDGKDIIIRNPQVMKVSMRGEESFQISGKVEKIEQGASKSYKEEDLELIMEKTGASKDEAEKALQENGGEVAKAIMELQQE